MATNKTITFNGIDYPSQIAATTALRSYVATLPLRVWLLPGDDRFETMLDALEYHWSWGDRLDEIVRLRFEREQGRGLACRVALSDGTEDKVGWTKAFGKEPSAHGKLMQSLRYEVRDQMQAVRDRIARGEIPAVCGLTKRPLTKGYEVDHYAPAFADLASDWIEARGGAERIAVRSVRGGGYEIVEDDVADDWWEHHRKHARLRPVNADAHSRRTRRQRRAV